MSQRNYNNVTTIGTLSAPLASSATTISTAGFTGVPTAPFTITLDRNTATEEICLVTAAVGAVLTVTRGFDGTAATAHAAGAAVEHTAGAIEYREANQHVNATSGVHGTTGDLVGDQGAQSIFDKTLVSPVAQADLTVGDAVVAYDPTGVRNLFRGIDSNGDDVIVVDTNGNISTPSIAVTGAATVNGALTAAGGITVPAGKTLTADGGVSTTTVTASGPVSATTLTGSGLVKGAGVESTAGVTLAQIVAPAGAASKGQLWAQSDGGLYARAGTAAVTRLPVNWGSGTTYPVSPLTGDTFTRTDLGPSLMRWNGAAWRQVETAEVASFAAISGLPTGSLYPGFSALDLSGKLVWRWNGTGWALFYTPPDGDWTYVGSGSGPTFANGWVNYAAAGHVPPRFRKLQNNQVELQGLVKNGTNGTTIFTLPAGYRPGYNLIFMGEGSAGNGPSRFDVNSDGTVTAFGSTDNHAVSFNATFYAEG